MPKLNYIRQDFLRVQPNMGIAVQVVNSVCTIGGLTRGLCLKFDGLTDVVTGHGNYEDGELLPMGEVFVYDTHQLLLATIVGQVFPGPATPSDTYDLRRKALWSGMMFTCQSNPGRPLYVPYMLCCGQAGDDWVVIEAILENLPNPVYVCVPNWAESAAELLGRLPSVGPVAVSTLPVDSAFSPMRSIKCGAAA